MPSLYPPIAAGSIAELAAELQLPPDALQATVVGFNRAVQAGTVNYAVLDDCATSGLVPEKSHWAQRIDTPPYWAYPLRPGITFTYLGVRVDVQGRVVLARRGAARNLFAAGEVMAGNVLRRGYLAGFGMTIGTVFGRIAGRGAAAYARG
jgi:tricarballylate dehydrogenase